MTPVSFEGATFAATSIHGPPWEPDYAFSPDPDPDDPNDRYEWRSNPKDSLPHNITVTFPKKKRIVKLSFGYRRSFINAPTEVELWATNSPLRVDASGFLIGEVVADFLVGVSKTDWGTRKPRFVIEVPESDDKESYATYGILVLRSANMFNVAMADVKMWEAIEDPRCRV